MTKLDDLLEKYNADLESVGEKVDPKFLRAFEKVCGPAINHTDASLVAFSDSEEVARIRKRFLIGKPGLKDAEKLGSGLDAVRSY